MDASTGMPHGPPRHAGPLTSETRRLRRLAGTLENLVDPQFGIIRYVGEEPRRPEFPDIFQYAAQTCDTTAFLPREAYGKTGGCSESRAAAFAKAVGEAVERYAAAIYDEAALPFTSFAEAPFPCVPPDVWAFNSPEQHAQPGFEWAPFTTETRARWVEARDLDSGEVVWVPAATVFVPYHYYLEEGEAAICQPISTGLACHCSPAEATIGGLCEVIERDAFTIAWQACLSPPRIDRATLPPAEARLLRILESVGAAITLFDITLDSGVPTVMAVQTHEAPDMPAITFACSTSHSAREAVRKALEELTHTGRWMFYLKQRSPPLETDDTFRSVDGQEAHLRFWVQHRHRHLADFVFAGSKTVAFDQMPDLSTGSPAHDLEVLVERVKATGYRPLVAEITPIDVRNAGLHVVRALIPGYHPLVMGHGIRALGGHRLWEVPQRLGYPGITRQSGDNPLPHPFP